MAAHPGEQRRGLRGPGRLQADLPQPVAVACGAELGGEVGGAHVEGLDREQRLARPVEEVEAVAVAGAADRGDRARVGAGAVEAFADHHRGALPELARVALDMAGERGVRGAVALARGELPAVRVEEHGLDDGVAGVEPEAASPGVSHLR